MTAAVLRTPYADRPPVQQQRRRGRNPRGIVRMLDYRGTFRPGVLAEIDVSTERSGYFINSGRRVRILGTDKAGFLCHVCSISGLLQDPDRKGPTLELWIPTGYLRRVWTGGGRP